MKKYLLILVTACLARNLKAQNIFPKKLDNCPTDMFCLDCGDIKGGVKQEEFDKMINDLNKQNDYSKLSGKVLFQVLIDSLGHGCVLSHTDVSNNPVTQNVVKHFNRFTGWTPAITSGKTEGKTSVNISITIKESMLTSKIERVDQEAFKKSFDRPVKPEIYNKDYVYKNNHLKNYTIKVWDSKNSNLPNNMDDHISIDNNNIIWLTIDGGLVTFDGKTFTNAEQNITEKGKFFDYYAIATANDNTKWVYGKNNIYSYDNMKWVVYDKSVIGIDGAYEIVNNENTGEVFFCSDEGLTIFKDGKWSNLNINTIKGMPSNRVSFAKRDSKNRLWIGTFSGSVLVDENQKVISFNATQTVLKDKCITSMDEDENGNVYLGLYEVNNKDKKSANGNEGFAIYNPDGEIKQFTTSNSGMPFNHVTKVLYDKNEKILWVATDRAGLVRYDLKNGWENYHNDDSDIPTSHISDMAFDKNGILYLATRQGLVKVERK